MTISMLLGISILLALGVVLCSLPTLLRPKDRRFLALSTLGMICLFPLLQNIASLLGLSWQLTTSQVSVAPEGSSTAPAMIYLLGLAVMTLRIVRELKRTTQLRKHSTPHPELSNVFVCSDVSSACAAGIIRPRVYLPAASADWTANTLSLVLQHERTHIRHHDTRWMLLTEMMRAVLWFHPLAHLMVNRIHQALEDACDEAVLDAGADRRNYAACLLDIAEYDSRTPMLAAAMSSRGMTTMSQRLRQIMSSQRHQNSTLWRTAFIGSIGTATLIAACHQPSLESNREANLAEEATIRLEANPFPAD